FRPGKVPLKMIEAQYGERLMEEVAGELIENSFREAIVQQGLRPAMGPRIERQTLARNHGLEYIAEFEVYPDIKKLDIAGSALERPVAEVSDDDVDRTLDTIRKQRTRWNPVAREAALGDQVKMDFDGKLDGEPLQGGSAKDFLCVLGGGTLIEDLEKGLVGAKAGDTRDVNATFPTDYRHQPLAGKSVLFTVSVHDVAEPALPEVNEEFAKQLGVQDGNVQTLRAEIKANLEREATQRTRRVLRARVLKRLREGNDFEVPKSMVENEVTALKRYAQSTGARPDDAALQTQARQRVTTGLILGEVIRARSIKADPALVRTKLEEMAGEYEQPAAFVQWHYEQPQRMAQIESLVTEERAVEELLAQARVEDKAVTFQELLQLEAQANQ
ncbi:MAG TPA: trigger factor, partial [Burkholderiales bacterium]|nr:trigger factor [Burkholderiales bacterium]